MQYVIEIRTAESKKQTFRIDASSESEALSRLKLRLPPDQRETVVVDSMKIDLTTVGSDDPFGVFGGE
jgi:hypothetical protein